MKERRAPLRTVAFLLVISLSAPSALLQGPPHTLQGAGPSGSTQPACFGYNNVDDSSIPRTIGALRIALIQPILTATPYSQFSSGSFYAFYHKEAGVTSNVTTDLGLLTTNVSSGYGFNHGWGLSYGTYMFFTHLIAAGCGLAVGKNVQVLTDMEVADGGLFHPGNHTARFDAVVLPFSEYVEPQEYQAFEDYVAGGGRLVMGAHSLEYPVTYNATTDMETLVYGHNWAFNGKYAYRTACGSSAYVATCPWAKNSTDWIGSVECCFQEYTFNGSTVNVSDPIGRALDGEFGGTAFKAYVAHEENGVTNMTGTSIVSVFVNDSQHLIAAYTHRFRRGLVVDFGVFGDDMITTDPTAQYFLLQGIAYGRPPPAPTSATTASSTATPAPTPPSSNVLTSSAQVGTASTSASARSSGTHASALLPLGAAAAAVVVTVGALARRRASRAPRRAPPRPPAGQG